MKRMRSGINRLEKSLNMEYMGKWLSYGALIGIVTCVCSVIFYLGLNYCSSIILGDIAGFHPPLPGGESSGHEFSMDGGMNYLLVLIPTIGGLISGIIVYSLAQEAEGHGTDSVINAFHKLKGRIRRRVPVVGRENPKKMVRILMKSDIIVAYVKEEEKIKCARGWKSNSIMIS